jgi:hypothetical protein
VTGSTTPQLDAAALIAMAGKAGTAACPACAALASPGWEALPGGFDTQRLEQVGTLRRLDVDDPTLAEHHPEGTNSWSDTAPIAPAFAPYNRCDVWRCRQCHRVFLRYTEYGGYYQEERIRALNPALVTDTRP